MPRSRDMISIRSDVAEVFGMTGAIQGMAKTINSNVYKNDVLGFVHGRMAREFDKHIALVASTKPENFRHVYEWRMVGNPSAQLWAHTLSGPMNNKLATWRWLPSRQPIMTPSERKRQGWDNMSNVPDDVIARLSGRRYYFRWKAPMMEFGMETVVAPKYAKRLFIPGYSPGTYYFSERPILKTAGGENNLNQFTDLWTNWWSSEALNVFDQSVQRLVEQDIARAVERGMRATKRPRSLKVSFGAATGNEAARAMAAASAAAHLQAQAAAYRRLGAYQGEDID